MMTQFSRGWHTMDTEEDLLGNGYEVFRVYEIIRKEGSALNVIVAGKPFLVPV